MIRSTHTKEKLDEFINKLESLGYNVIPIRKKPQIFSINNELVNVRCRGKEKTIAGGRGYWYSIAFNVLQEVKWVIYVTTTSDYFFIFPNTFLDNLKDQMYLDKQKSDTGVFDLDWDNLKIVLKQGEIKSIDEYYYNLLHDDDYPIF